MKRDALIASLTALSMAFAAPAFAAKTSQDEQPTAGSAKSEKKTCKTFANTASRMKSTRLCLTKAEWKKFESAQ